MPCFRCADGKWKYGRRGRCQFDSLAACQRAEAAILADDSYGGASMSDSQAELFPTDEWRTNVSSGDASNDVLLRKEFVTEVEPGADRTIKFTISTGSADREKDIINPSGWDTTNYLQNPVVLFAHDYDSLPVARAISLRQDGDTLVAEAQFADAELNPMAEQVYQMLKQGFLRGASVGFRPLSYQFNEERGGVDFDKQELLEFSVVPVPANPGALMSAGLKAADVALITKWAKDTLAAFDLPEGDDSAPDGPMRASFTKAPIRDQLDDFLDVMRKAMNDIKVSVREAIKNVDEFQDTFQYSAVNGDDKSLEPSCKGVTPPNPSGFGEAPVNEVWKKPTLSDFTDASWTDLSDTERRSIATHFAWSAASVPETFGEMKLPHHKATGDVVWRGVASAAAYLDATQLPSDDVGAVKRHLANHYKQFDRDAPWERDVAGWTAYCKARAKLMAKSDGSLSPERLAHLLDDFGFEDEAVVLVTPSSDESKPGGGAAAPSSLPIKATQDVVGPVLDALDGLSATLAAGVGIQSDHPVTPDDCCVELEDGEEREFDLEDVTAALHAGLNDTIGDVVGSEVRAALSALRGRID